MYALIRRKLGKRKNGVEDIHCINEIKKIVNNFFPQWYLFLYLIWFF